MRPRVRRTLPCALLVSALIAAACGGSSEDADGAATVDSVVVAQHVTTTIPPPTTLETTSTTKADPGKQYGGEVVVVQNGEPPALNPYVAGGGYLPVQIVGQCYLAGVSEIDGYTLELVPELVTELPTIDNGGLTVNEDNTMTVRYRILDEAIWSDGTPISGDDFQFTLDTIMDPDVEILKVGYEDIISTNVQPKTFSYTLKQPTTQYDSLFGLILPKHAVEGTDFTTDWNNTMWPSAGPFIFDTWEKGDFIRVVRNDNYWKADASTGQPLPYLDSVVFRFVPDSESVITSFKAREADLIPVPPSPGAIEPLQALVPEGAIVEVLSGTVWEHLNFQFGPGRLERNGNSANSSLNYRKGVAHTIDKDLIVDEILAGQVEPLDSFVDVFSPSISTGAWAQYDYDPDRAREYFEAARAELGVDELHAVFTTTSNGEMRVKLSVLFKSMFEEVGVVFENELEDSTLFFGETMESGLWDLGEWAWVGASNLSSLVGIFDVFDPEAPPPEGANLYHWGTEDSSVIDDSTVRFAEIRDLLNTSVDENVLIPLIQDGEQILADQVVIFPLFARLSTAAVWGDEVGGFKHNPTEASYTWNIEEWYRANL